MLGSWSGDIVRGVNEHLQLLRAAVDTQHCVRTRTSHLVIHSLLQRPLPTFPSSPPSRIDETIATGRGRLPANSSLYLIFPSSLSITPAAPAPARMLHDERGNGLLAGERWKRHYLFERWFPFLFIPNGVIAFPSLL